MIHHKNSKDKTDCNAIASNCFTNIRLRIFEQARVYLNWIKLKHESLILAQDERWRRA